MNNIRAWRAAIEICRILDRIREDHQLRDFQALRFWAENADYNKWFEDPVGRIPGVGLVTFQYLRMQAGIDTSMPDKIIRKVVEREFGIRARDLELIKELENLSKETGYSQIILGLGYLVARVRGSYERLGRIGSKSLRFLIILSDDS